MGSLVLMVVAAIWVAVLVPPLLRSRLENRPNSSVMDFRNQLSSLQRAMPTGRTATMRGMARPLAPVSIARPPANARPLRSGVSLAAGSGTTRSASQQAAMRPARSEPARHADPAQRARARTHAREATGGARRPAAPAPAGRDLQKRRRANVLFVLALTAACTVFLAVTAKSPAMTYLAVGTCVAFAAYVAILAQRAPRPVERAVAPRPAEARRVRRAEPVEDWYEEVEPVRSAPVRSRGHRDQRDRRSETVETRRPRHVREGYDPTPSGLVYGEPDLTRNHHRPVRRSSSRGSRSMGWSPA